LGGLDTRDQSGGRGLSHKKKERREIPNGPQDDKRETKTKQKEIP